MPSGVYERPILEDRFWSKVDIKGKDDCWNWKAGKFKNGYGVININGKVLRSHRVAWELTKEEPIPDGIFVCHQCDNPPCCNPNHLFLGTSQDNMTDKVSKNRQSKGEQNGRAILTEEQVLAIRQDTRIYREIAEDYSVSCRNISYIKLGKRWKHI